MIEYYPHTKDAVNLIFKRKHEFENKQESDLVKKILTDTNSLMSERFKVAKVIGVYFLFQGDTLIYIGKSKDVFFRAARHIKALNYTSFAYIEVPENLLSIVERLLISVYMPHCNCDAITQKIRHINNQSCNIQF